MGALPRLAALGFTAALGALAPVCAWAQPVAIESASVAIVPAGSSDVDDILALERGVEFVLCQAGVKPRGGGRETPRELKLVASLTQSDFEADRNTAELAARCKITSATAILPGGETVALPDLAIARRYPIERGRSAAELFFLGCGASFTRTALDALKERVTLRGPGCEAIRSRD